MRVRNQAATAGQFARFAWLVLGFNLLVILWGAFVRATGSGAGCGSHWPLCNGEVVPWSPSAATVIEFTHRVTSGLDLLLVAMLLYLAWQAFPPAHRVRKAVVWSAVFLVMEALIGAGLVLLKYVADDTRLARGYWVGGHLVNTFLLVAALTLTAWWGSGAPAIRLRQQGGKLIAVSIIALAVLALGTTGAITALGDTLFPSSTLAEGELMTFASSSHLFVRLRVWHPVLAFATGLVVFSVAWILAEPGAHSVTKQLAAAVVATYLVQLAIGMINLLWLAPTLIQVAHLLVADILWIFVVLMSASALRAE